MTLREAGSAVARTGDRVAETLANGVNAVAEVLSDAIETAGSAVQDGASAAASHAGAARGLLHWIGDAVAAATDLAAAVVKGVLGAVGSALAGVLRMVVGGAGALAGGDPDAARAGAPDVGAGVVGCVIVVTGKLVALVQTVLVLQARRMPPTAAERMLLERVFRGGLAPFNVRIVDGRSGIFGLNHRPFTLGNTIYMKSSRSDVSTLVHEATHVWQYQQRGARYAADALGAQAFVEDPYDWRLHIDRGRADWTTLNAEAQAELVRDAYRFGGKTGQEPAGRGEFFDAAPPAVELTVDAVDYTAVASEAALRLRRRRPLRASALIR